MPKFMDFILIIVSSVLLAVLIIYFSFLSFFALHDVINFLPQHNVLRYNSIAKNVYFSKISSLDATFDFYSSLDKAEILLYGYVNDTGMLEKNIFLKSEDEANIPSDIREYHNFDFNGDLKPDGECAELFTNSNFILKLNAIDGNKTFTYDISVVDNLVTLSGFSDNTQIILYSDEEIHEFPVTTPLESIQYEILNCSKIIFKVHKATLDNLENLELIKITYFSSLEIVSYEANIDFSGKSYHNISGNSISNKGSAIVYVNPLAVDINAELASAWSDNQNLIPSIWLKPFIVFQENVVTAIFGMGLLSLF